MPAAGLAAESGVPLLLVNAAGVPPATGEELKRWHGPAIYVVGSSAAVSSATVAALAHYGTVKRVVSPTGRIEPGDPVGNAIAVALFSDGGFGWGVERTGARARVPQRHAPARRARGGAALSERPLRAAAAARKPRCRAQGARGIPRDSSAPHTPKPRYRPVQGAYNHGWLIGDESAISATTQAELDGLLEISPQTTTTSDDRFASDDNDAHDLATVAQMSQAEDPNPIRSAADHEVTVEDVRVLMGASTPHFALQLRARIAKLIAGLPPGHPARVEGEREIERLRRLGLQGETRGEGLHEAERPLPSLSGVPAPAAWRASR